MPKLRFISYAVAATVAAIQTPAAACPALEAIAGTQQDATPILVDCIKRAAHAGVVEIPAANFVLRTQFRIEKRVTLKTKGIATGAANCRRLPLATCAMLKVRMEGRPNPNIMPIEIVSDGVVLTHLVIEGSKASSIVADCRLPDRRPLGGGIRVIGSGFTMRKSILRNFTCYTTMEVLARSKRLVIEDNYIGPNGDHRPGDIWTDGVTIHDSSDAVVRRNTFIDNTDVQLILGGCRRCRIEDNVFGHSGSFARASFAELMLQAFPSTTGDYTDTVVTRNRIDCGKKNLCGYGIMIGANPWKTGENARYPGAMFGGMISQNEISNALIAINIDSPTGPVTIRNNKVKNSGGRFNSDCGRRDWPSVNVAPAARPFVRGDPSSATEGSVVSTSCIVNRRKE